MNRTIEALTQYHADLLDQIAERFDEGESVVFLVTDDEFAPDAQIWTVAERDELLEQYARSAASVWGGISGGGSYKKNLKRIKAEFARSRAIYHVDPSDLTEARAALAEEAE